MKTQPIAFLAPQTALAVGAARAVRPRDKFSGTHRAHHQYLAKALSACMPASYDPLRDGLTGEMQDHVLVLLRETMGLAGGCNAIGPKLIRTCEQRWFDDLDAPAASVNALDVPLPVSRRLELLCLPDVARTATTIRRAARREV